MKKVLSVIITVTLLLFALCSCGLTVTETDNEASEAAAFSTTAGKNTEKKTEITETVSLTENSKTETTTEKSTTSKTAKATEKATEKSTTSKTAKATEKATEKSTTSKTAKATEKATEKTSKKETVTEKQITCTFEISCKNILDKKENLKENKSDFLPENGMILNSVKVTVPEGSTAFDVIKKACEENTCTDNCKYCKQNGIQLDYVYTPGYDSYYIRGIHQIYEKDCGTQSGWMYSINGTFPNYGCSQYKVRDGDIIKFMYTCDLGEDLEAGC